VGKHGDEDRHGVVPNATLVVYLTGSTGGAATAAGQTIFPEAGVAVSPTPGEP
jgi:molybdopterin biosynthesis enzyme MoaB